MIQQQVAILAFTLLLGFALGICFHRRFGVQISALKIAVTKSNFTPRAQKTLLLAMKQAERLHHRYVGTEHLLLALIELGEGCATKVMQKIGLNLEAVRAAVENHVGVAPEIKMVGNTPWTPRVKKVLALAGKEAKVLNHSYVGTEHLLLGLLREGDGVAARVLKQFGVNSELTRLEVLRALDPKSVGTGD